ncbi:polymorphic toxin type 44 domain-containing protein [Kitasatospora herbaricolor]|uniref:Polymorphic toxin type 44 domain-containing protein n=1 Tax=Kitasatospora herbaricolor TaxID=68217 RepID=A0ABZ1WFP9_9ACTN|nr:polymorphic toxin type 44 domain-containing protein [Kitasatospora herbaricolor]
MLSYEQVLAAPLEELAEAAAKWQAAIKPLGEQQDAYRDRVIVPVRDSDWQGADADAAKPFMDKVSKELRDATKEAEAIHGVLVDAHREIDIARLDLRRLTDVEAPKMGRTVGPGGEVKPLRPVDPDDPDTWGPHLDFFQALAWEEDVSKQLSKAIINARARAHEADRAAAWALWQDTGADDMEFNPGGYANVSAAKGGLGESKFRESSDFIFAEMKTNSASPKVAEIRGLVKGSEGPLAVISPVAGVGSRGTGLALWYEQVKTGGPWDHKPQLEKKFDLQSNNDFYFKVPGREVSVSDDIYSNIHYGYVGRAAGISRPELMQGANGGIASTGTNDPGDDMSMKVGMDLYEKYGDRMTKEQMDAAILKLVDDMEARRRAGDTTMTQVRPW